MDPTPALMLPSIGFGVYRIPADETQAAVEAALEAGYRLIDTAAAYGNEREVGAALRSTGLAGEVAVETKLWISDYADAARGFEKSARKLGVDRIDLLLLHQPLPSKFALTVQAWRELEALAAAGAVGAIGVSNFSVDELDRLVSESQTTPAVNQVELHPHFPQRELQRAHDERGIRTQAWSPLGGATVYGEVGGTLPVDDEAVVAIAAELGHTPAQVILRWHVQQGRSAVPKSLHVGRIRENVDVFGFALSDAQLAVIDALDLGVRRGPVPSTITLERHWKDIPAE